MKTSAKALIAVAGLAVVVTAIAVGSGQSRASRGTAVRTAQVEERDLVAIVTASGNVRATRKVDISSDISARVTSLLVEEGDQVEAGQLLIQLDPTRLEAATSQSEANLAQARSGLARSRANLARARREAERMRALHDRDSLLVSIQDVENAETDFLVQQSDVEGAEHAVNQAQGALIEARDNLAKTTIRAPMSGTVTRLNVEAGETVVVGTMNNPGSLILTVSDLSTMEVVLEVDETDVPQISLGDSAKVELDAFPDLEFQGRVTEIGNSAIRSPSESAGSGATPTIDFEVVVTLVDPPVELRPDLSATADLITEERDGAMSIPIIALTERDRKEVFPDEEEGGTEALEGVFVVQGDSVSFVPVEVGIAGQEYFEVLSGLALGDTIVRGPYQTIRRLGTGDRVSASESTENEGDGS